MKKSLLQIAIRVVNMPTEDWELVLLGGIDATLLNYAVVQLRCLLVKGLGMACSIC